jgi:hypothetical protein
MVGEGSGEEGFGVGLGPAGIFEDGAESGRWVVGVYIGAVRLSNEPFGGMQWRLLPKFWSN